MWAMEIGRHLKKPWLPPSQNADRQMWRETETTIWYAGLLVRIPSFLVQSLFWNPLYCVTYRLEIPHMVLCLYRLLGSPASCLHNFSCHGCHGCHGCIGCHRCHGKPEDAPYTVVARLRMMMRPMRPWKTRQGSTCQDDRGRFNQFFSGHNIWIHEVFSPFSVQEDWEKTDISCGKWIKSPKKTCTATFAKYKWTDTTSGRSQGQIHNLVGLHASRRF